MRKLSLTYADAGDSCAWLPLLSPTTLFSTFPQPTVRRVAVPATVPARASPFSTTQTISDMQFYLDSPNGGDFKFFIYDSTNTNLLFLTTYRCRNPISQNPTWVSSAPFNFTSAGWQHLLLRRDL